MSQLLSDPQRFSGPTVLRLPMNQHGRDFVIGDVHGGFDSVIEGMRAVKFDRARDRLLCAGDLVDRGPGSHRVVEFLQQPYVFSVRGNHDDEVCTLDLESLRVLGRANWNGMGWVCEQSDDRLLQVQAALRSLPLVMEVQTPRGLVGIVHADVPAQMDWPTFVHRLETGDEVVLETALTGRDRFKRRNCKGVEGVGRVYVGHTIQWEGARRLGNVYAIDTGAVFCELEKDKGFLTMANLIHHSVALVHHQGGVQVIDDPSDEPFGLHIKEIEPVAVASALRDRG